jgi:hypothetical protein
MTRVEADRMGQEPPSLVWRLFLTLVAWSTLTACSLVLTGTGTIGLGMILNHFGVAEITRLKIYVTFMLSPARLRSWWPFGGFDRAFGREQGLP